MNAPVFTAKRGDEIGSSDAVFIAWLATGGVAMHLDGMRAVVLESRAKGDRRVLMVAPDDTDTIEHVTVRASSQYLVETMTS